MDLLKEFETKTAEFINQLKDTLSGIRGGRPSAKLVEDIAIDYSGGRLKIKQLGSITVIPPREIQISVWDASIAGAVGTAVEAAIKAQTRAEGNTVRVSLPPLSEERREELIRLVKREAENSKIKIRNMRDDILKRLKSKADEKEFSEDERFKTKEKIDKVNQAINETVESLLNGKIKEISE